MPAAAREQSRESEHHEPAVARCVRFCFVADGEPSRGLPLWPDEDREEKYGGARAGPTGWIRLRLKQKA